MNLLQSLGNYDSSDPDSNSNMILIGRKKVRMRLGHKTGTGTF